MSYIKGDITKPDVYKALSAEMDAAETKHKTGGNAIFYLAVGDRFFGEVVDQLGAAGLADQKDDENGTATVWRRVVIEKPFGHDLASAQALNSRILKTLHEDQIFRIDHFLGKETVQAIMAFRFANGLFEPIWNRDRIDHVQITAAETVGVEARGAFYEVTGALRDMVPNHVFSLLAMVAMEAPATFDATGIRNRKAEVFTAMPPLKPEAVVRGQYGAGAVGGVAAKPYREEMKVDPNSNTETYVALRVEIDNWRWAGVPFYLRTGKHMAARLTEIAIRFKPAPLSAFATTAVEETRPNWLIIRIQPKEGISLQFDIKRPGPSFQLGTVRMNFSYADWFPQEPNIGYETLIHDVMVGDATLFNRADMVEAAWKVVQPVLDDWAENKTAPEIYPSGSNGPAGADALLANDGDRAWRDVPPAGA
jgi:glucose-6-phosphate 1-dehydrogenase